jgi:PAS domain S-box-containing protein
MNLKKTKHKFTFIILFLSLFLSFLPATVDTTFVLAQGERKQVLFINSYHPGYKFSDEITSGVAAVFKKQGNIDLRIEYLDTKRISDPEYFKQISQLFEHKYKNAKLDLVMSSDDAALNFLFENADALFPNTPIVFVGANYFDETRLEGHELFTGISEEADIQGTLDTALAIHPDVNNVVVINDTTVTGQRLHDILTVLIPKYPKIKFELLEDVTMINIRQQLAGLSSNSLVLLTIFSKDKSGNFYEYDQYTSLISASSAVPVYGVWDFSLGYGIVGGKLTSGKTEGERAANLAIRILNGESPHTIPVDKQLQSRYMFDYKVLEKWGIDTSRLPEGSVIIDRPASLYEEYKGVMWAILIGFIILVFIIAFLIVNNNQRRKAEAELAASNRELQATQASLEQRVTDRTKALATVAEVGTATATILETDKLLQNVVDISKDRFDLYHAHIYLLDEAGENLVLASGAGEPGRQMMAKGLSIPLNREQSLVARAAREQKGVTVNDVTQAPEFLPNPLLPNTRSELAVPMIAGGKMIGVFDVQSDVAGRFTDSDINIQTTLAAQVTTSIQNARQVQQTIATAAELAGFQGAVSEAAVIATTDLSGKIETANDNFVKISQYSREELIGQDHRILNSGYHSKEFIRNLWVTIANGKVWRNEVRNKAKDGSFYWMDTTIAPILNERGKPIKYVTIRFNITQRKELEEETARQASTLVKLDAITQKIQNTTSVEEALQVTACELGHALGMKTTLVALDPAANIDRYLESNLTTLQEAESAGTGVSK